jgi:PKD repeat protein
LPAYATLPVEYSFRALDLGAPYRNNSSFAGGKYEDEYLQVNAGKDQFIKVGDTTVLTAGSKALSNLLISDIVQFKNAIGAASGEIYPGYIPTSPDDDYIEVTNISNGNADISGYTIRVLGQTLAGIIDYSYVVPSGAIIPSGQVAVFSWATTGTDHVNRFYGMSFGTTTQSIYANGYIIKSPTGQVVDAVGTNGYTFDPAITGVTSSDWSGNIGSSSNGVVRIANADNNLATDFTPSVAAGPIVTIGVFNTNLPIVPATVSVTWTGGLFVGTKTGASVSTPAHPIAGAYSYVAKIDDNTCTDRDTVVVRVLARPIVSLGVDGSICAGTRILDAGVYPFAKYLWSTGETTRTISVSAAGTYSVTVTDSARNVVRDTINLIGGPAFTAQLGANRDLCIGGNITLTPAITGATTPSCVWSTGDTTMAINVTTAGTYSMIATNESGCMSFDTIEVTLLQTNPVVNLGPNQTICKSSPSTLDAGNAGSTYLWSTGATTQTIAVANAGSYSVIVNTPTGCTLYDTISITNLPDVIVSLGANQEVCPGSTTTLDAGNAGLTYLWSTGATTQTITAAPGTYTVAVTNASGCVGVDTIVVTNKIAPVVSLGADQSICTSDTITLDAGNAGATYLWSTGATTQTIRVSLANTYTVAVTNAAGCTTNDAIVITNKAVPISTFTTQVVDTTKGQQVKFTAVSAAGTSYAWNFGDPNSASNTSSLSSPTHLFSAAGNYTVTLTVTNVGTGCKSVTQTAVSVTGLANDFAKAFKLVAAPNPFAGNTKINYELPSNANVTLEVYDMIGRKVSTIANAAYQESGVHTYDFSAGDNQNASGVYMVRLIVDGQVAILRVIDIANR